MEKEGRGGHDHAGHSHGSHNHAKDASEQRLRAALALLFSFTLVEAAGGFWANSIALLAEAAHMLADSASLLLAIIAIRFGRRPASAERSYGHQRYQTLAAYTNGVTLLVLTVWVIVEAAERLIAPPQVNGGVMLGVAAVGAVANLAAFVVLSGARSLNERGARAHVLSDLVGSGAAIAAACVILATGWLPADPLLSIAVSALIFRSGWQLTRESSQVLLQGAPPGFEPDNLEQALTALAGVSGIHDLHAWSLTGEAPIVTLHAVLREGTDHDAVLAQIHETLRQRFGVAHATVQMEVAGCDVAELTASEVHDGNPHRPGSARD
ncbi:MAG: cation transporter [Nevskia sp.]|nr:cation transporter [Nevskia sp.]